ncbi:glutathione synthase [Anseongella ginsenosidimutans]|uniref:Glutathione synthetase n=1 Tax=Anseongella ginsenosidimutans TaxID=496056 RepID=A0A4V2UTG4_9SPHI|nr:glutathione synthetase [Anseongella ginsenosidimutans]QEC53710.1 glutathione synthase [Anseongella ginsenosidimutans]TCS86039.1 glutathione synthase [Anseongella ginsenosidimutans]
MKIGFIVNQVKKEDPNFTTTGLAWTAHKRGHEVYYMGVGDLAYYSDEQVGAHARKVPDKKFNTRATFMDGVKSAAKEKITSAGLDVLMLRNDPAEDIEKRSWAQSAGMIFSQMAVKQGVIVLNDPQALSTAINKMYFQHFPEIVRPKTIISRNVEDIKAFFEETRHKMVMKPLQGSGGRNVFLVTKKEASNINQMFEAISRDGYVVGQEYLEEAKQGDIRLFLMNGSPIEVKGKIAMLNRLQKEGDIRSNIHRGGKAFKGQISDTMLELAESVKPKLIKDGMFLVGIDIVGNKLMEINVFSPGGLGNASELHKTDFITPVIEAIEKKVAYKKIYGDNISNVRIATI